jgi:hypothetical protein
MLTGSLEKSMSYKVETVVAEVAALAEREKQSLAAKKPELLTVGAILPYHYVGNTLKTICRPIAEAGVRAGVYDSTPSSVFVDGRTSQGQDLIAALNAASIPVAWDTVRFTVMTDGERDILGIDPSMEVRAE